MGAAGWTGPNCDQGRYLCLSVCLFVCLSAVTVAHVRTVLDALTITMDTCVCVLLDGLDQPVTKVGICVCLSVCLSACDSNKCKNGSKCMDREV